MSIIVECRTCLGKFGEGNILHVATKLIDQKNVLQAIEEVASIQVLDCNGFPEHICRNCFKTLESTIIFRQQIISSYVELKRRLSPGKHTLHLLSDPLLVVSDNVEQNNENKYGAKEENEIFSTLGDKEVTSQTNKIKNSDDSLKYPVKDSDSDWNDCNDNLSASDDDFIEEINKNSHKLKKNTSDKSSKENLLVKSNENKNNVNVDDDSNDGTIKKFNKCSLKSISEKSPVITGKDDTKSSKYNNTSDSNFNENSEINSSSDLTKKTLMETRKVRRIRRVKKAITDVSDTSSDSDSDSDIPLGELMKEMKNLENNKEPKVRKKREKKDKMDGPRLCPICGKLFKARQNFNSHMTTVHRKKNDKPEKISCLCPDCGRVISGTRQNFVAHRRYHHSEKAQVKKRFTCDICPRKFYREKNLIIHQRIHKGEKGYVCELCPDKSYTQIGGLILHRRKVHLKKPTCTCNYCGKQFYEKHYLETHIRQWHTGERPFSCEICGKSFSCNGTLLRHRKDSHGEKQPCPKCGKMYTEGELRKHLKRHKIREEGIKRKKYTCEYCGTEMNFTSRKRHLLKQHGIMLRGRGETAERIPISRADAM